MLTPDQTERARVALNHWYTNPGGSNYQAPGVTWDTNELQLMHEALEAHTLDEALTAFGITSDPLISSPEQYARNKADMKAVRNQMRRR